MIRSSDRNSNIEVDPPPSGAPWATSLTAKWSTTLA